MRRLTVLTALLLTAVLVAAGLQPAGAADRPVPYSFLPYAAVGGIPPGGDAPGSNDWTCRPTARHPRPVVLVHGTAGNKATNWQTYAPLLSNQGYCVFALTYGLAPYGDPATANFGGMARMQQSAEELKAFVAKVLKRTGASKVDLVGHSQGTLMPNYYVKFLDGAKHVKRYVSLAPLWKGTQASGAGDLAAAAFGMDPEATAAGCEACAQFAPGSAFMRKMRKGGVAVPGIEYTNIVTEYDQLVIPYTSGLEPGMRNHVVQDHCGTDYSEHFQIAADKVASVLVLNALDPARKRPVPCPVVLPFVGTPAG